VNLKVVTGAIITIASVVPVLAQSGNPINPPTNPQTTRIMSGSEQQNLDLVLKWWREVIEAHHTELVEKYLAEDFIQHNPNIPNGRAALVKALSRVSESEPMPEKLSHPPVVEGAKGDFVWLIFENEAPDPHDLSKTYYYCDFDLLRLQNGKIQEHWDSAKRVSGSADFVAAAAPPPSSWNASRLSATEQHNIGIVADDFKAMLQYGHIDVADKSIGPDYIEHNPYGLHGREAFMQSMSSLLGCSSGEMKPECKSDPSLTLANGPYVLRMWQINDKDPTNPIKTYTRSHFDLLRIEDGLEKEHWDGARMERKKVALDVRVLSSYLGSYSITPQSTVVITIEDGHLMAQATREPKLALGAESNTIFMLENAEVAIEFVRDPQGRVTGLIVHQGRRDIKALKQ
jgi:predicted SnoaL-like aldol condensation-catalyzing enzyme